VPKGWLEAIPGGLLLFIADEVNDVAVRGWDKDVNEVGVAQEFARRVEDRAAVRSFNLLKAHKGFQGEGVIWRERVQGGGQYL
jgi:hypothetical protein